MVAASNDAKRIPQTLTTEAMFVLAAFEQMPDHLVVSDQGRIIESRNGIDDLATNTVA